MGELRGAHLTMDDTPGPKSIDELTRLSEQDPETGGGDRDVPELVRTIVVKDRLFGREGRFTLLPPDIDRRIGMSRMRARLLGPGVEWTHLTADEQELIDAIVWATLGTRDRPEWFDDVMGARIPHVIMQVGAEARRHAAQWFRGMAPVDPQGQALPLVEIEEAVGE